MGMLGDLDPLQVYDDFVDEEYENYMSSMDEEEFDHYVDNMVDTAESIIKMIEESSQEQQ